MSEFIDISLGIHEEILSWPNMPEPEIKSLKSIESGDEVNNSWVGMDVHTGTHIDSPKHHLKKGTSVDELSLDKFAGKAYVLEINKEEITGKVIKDNEDIFKKNKRILLKTKNSDMSKTNFNQDYVGLDQSAVKEVTNHEIELLGIDYLSIQKYNEKNIVHKNLLKKDITILEGINLNEVNEGEYELFAFPIKLKNLEGAPVRAILRG